MLYCALTGQLVDKSLDAVKKHMQGKRFERAKGALARSLARVCFGRWRLAHAVRKQKQNHQKHATKH
jgi:hypothetical protein